MTKPAACLLLLLFLQTGCSPADSPDAGARAPSRSAVASAPFERQQTARAEFVVYHLKAPAPAALASLQGGSAAIDGALRVVDQVPDPATDLTATIREIGNPKVDFPVPDADQLQYFGRGISKEQVASVAASVSAWHLVFAYPARQAGSALAIADRSVLELARLADALIWDSETRLMYSPDAFASEFVDVPDAGDNVIRQTTIHAYQDEDYVRAVSLGMSKFGLPDLVIEEMSWATQSQLGWLMVGIAQQLVEGAEPDAAGMFAFDAAAIRNAQVREKVHADPIGEATFKGQFRLVTVAPDEGDADNALLAIGFDAYAGNDDFARQDAAAAQIFGWHDEIKRIEHNDELTAASAAARLQLPRLRHDFEAGLEPQEYIQVKAPFPTSSNGREWMWVEITRWEDDVIHGLLRNEPFDIPDLHAGQKVEVDPDEVFDYLRLFADGREEGNSTGAVIERMQGEVEADGSD